jgi:hypothetical protein
LHHAVCGRFQSWKSDKATPQQAVELLEVFNTRQAIESSFRQLRQNISGFFLYFKYYLISNPHLGELKMLSVALKAVLFVLAVSGVATTGYVYYNGGLSPDNWIFQGGSAGNWADGGIHGAPGPLAGAGLPIAVIAYGVYRLVNRRRKAD